MTPAPRLRRGPGAEADPGASGNSTAAVRLVVDRRVCAGHGMCYCTAPDLVEPDEQGDPVIVLDPVPDIHRSDAETAVAACPERALTLALTTTPPTSEESPR
ncbi:ferredoxin [Nocardia rhamnosiphila]|uniref:ferredoxin n=1 Tax=Nocardia rhamnosiphila TaxID=426716 RepID=UPI0033CFA2C5